MTELETLEAAVARLDSLSSHADTENWFAARHYVGAGEDRGDPHTEIASCGDLEIAQLIATLGRTAATIQVIMQQAIQFPVTTFVGQQYNPSALALARAVLGGAP